MLIDLTAEFGAGSEPDQDWCDKNIILGQVEMLLLSLTLVFQPSLLRGKLRKGMLESAMWQDRFSGITLLNIMHNSGRLRV